MTWQWTYRNSVSILLLANRAENHVRRKVEASDRHCSNSVFHHLCSFLIYSRKLMLAEFFITVETYFSQRYWDWKTWLYGCDALRHRCCLLETQEKTACLQDRLYLYRLLHLVIMNMAKESQLMWGQTYPYCISCMISSMSDSLYRVINSTFVNTSDVWLCRSLLGTAHDCCRS
jgi:hypothetical protein